MISAAHAWHLIEGRLSPPAPIALPLEQAVGAWLAEPLLADRAIPPADRAAMDGFAVRHGDLGETPVMLRVIGEVAAGEPAEVSVAAGECVRILTGANVPPGADTVVKVEDTSSGRFAPGQELPCRVTIEQSSSRGSHIFCRAENAEAGQVVVAAGRRLGPGQVAIAAFCGYGEVSVTPPVRVAILTTGAELLAHDAPAPGSHEIRDSNGPFLAAACLADGFRVCSRRVVPDDLQETQELIVQAAREAQAVILTGGVSAGSYDFVRPALEAMGATIHYHGVAIKPGKPQLFATLAEGTAVFGLPGNPLSAVVGWHEFVRPALRLLAGHPSPHRPCLRLPLGAPAGKQSDRLQVIPAVLATDEAGTRVLPRPPVGSADLLTAGLVSGAILIPADAGPQATGQVVSFRPWGDLDP